MIITIISLLTMPLWMPAVLTGLAFVLGTALGVIGAICK